MRLTFPSSRGTYRILEYLGTFRAPLFSKNILFRKPPTPFFSENIHFWKLPTSFLSENIHFWKLSTSFFSKYIGFWKDAASFISKFLLFSENAKSSILTGEGFQTLPIWEFVMRDLRFKVNLISDILFIIRFCRLRWALVDFAIVDLFTSLLCSRDKTFV